MGNTQSQQKSTTKFKFFAPKQQESQYTKLKQDIKKGCECSMKTRIIGFIICSLIGWTLQILAVISYLINRQILTFALLFSFGQVVNISATFFLAGPARQAKNMTSQKRIVVSSIFVLSVIGTILFAILLPHQPVFTIVCLVAQVVSYFFYCLSYIPMGQKMLAGMCKCCLT